MKSKTYNGEVRSSEKDFETLQLGAFATPGLLLAQGPLGLTAESGLIKSPTQNVALIGFMAVGKSAVGRSLAKKLRLRFVDLDQVIEKTAGMKISEIFIQKGEPYFRQLEKETLAKVLQGEQQVIATGGGVIMDDDSLMLLRDRALLIGLTASVDVLLTRAGSSSKRPLLQDANRKERVEELLTQRQSRYAQAHVTIDTSELTVDQVVEKICSVHRDS